MLDRAVGTTFTLDLMTLLAVPLAFTFSDVQDRDGQIPTEPLSLLESARRYADRIVVFCHGGQTGVPRARQPALAFIEQSVIAGFPPRRGQLKGIFHPKVWVLRYAARGDTADEPIRYRLVCQSRNLTFDASWDASLVLDGELNQERAREYPLNGSLAEFLRALPALAVDRISNFQEESIEILANELPSVRFDPPEGLELSRFLPFGIGPRNFAYPDLEHRPLLVVSPFLDGGFLQSVTRRRPRSVLISRREALLTAPATAVRAFDEVYAFKSGLEPESEDTEESLPPLAGLHAKVYVIDDGWKARVGIGSANSTEAALGDPPRNVEFMVELVGSKSKFGIDALLAPPSQGEGGTFRSLIEEFDPQEAGTVVEDEDTVRLDYLLDDAAETIARADLTGTVDDSDTGRYTLRLALDEPPGLPAEIGTVACWPATLAAAHQQPLEHGVAFANLTPPTATLTGLTGHSWTLWNPPVRKRPVPKEWASGLSVVRESRFATRCTGRPLRPSGHAGRRYRRPRGRDSRCAPSRASWECHGLPPRSTPWRRVLPPNASAPKSVPRRRRSPHRW